MRKVSAIDESTLQEIDTAVQSVNPEATNFCDAVGRLPESWSVGALAAGVFTEPAQKLPEGLQIDVIWAV